MVNGAAIEIENNQSPKDPRFALRPGQTLKKGGGIKSMSTRSSVRFVAGGLQYEVACWLIDAQY